MPKWKRWCLFFDNNGVSQKKYIYIYFVTYIIRVNKGKDDIGILEFLSVCGLFLFRDLC